MSVKRNPKAAAANKNPPLGAANAFHSVKTLNDYSYFKSFSGMVYGAHPTTAVEVAKYVRAAIAENKKIRMRGRGHSMNGTSLPSSATPEELLLFTERLDYYEVLSPDRVKVGAGITMLAVKKYMELMGIGVQVYSDGDVYASSVGGYVCAGGIGITSKVFGGFWETVESITIVDGMGNIQRINPEKPEFKWLFGSMGQLGVVVDVTLKVTKLEHAVEPDLPNKGRLPHEFYTDSVTDQHPPTSDYWFSVICPQRREHDVLERLAQITHTHRYALSYYPVYRYDIAFQTFNPPLMYPHNEAFVLTGIWGQPISYDNEEAIRSLEKSFRQWINSDSELYRYIQAEYIPNTQELALYFSKEIRQQFGAIKNRFDPDDLFPRYL